MKVVETEETRDDILDMPTPWSPKLVMKKDAPEDMYYASQKTIFYLKSKVDIYARYSQVPSSSTFLSPTVSSVGSRPTGTTRDI
jgi:hypothetical protein